MGLNSKVMHISFPYAAQITCEEFNISSLSSPPPNQPMQQPQLKLVYVTFISVLVPATCLSRSMDIKMKKNLLLTLAWNPITQLHKVIKIIHLFLKIWHIY
jgi:hypothetical protein